jgi:hypothetical protein
MEQNKTKNILLDKISELLSLISRLEVVHKYTPEDCAIIHSAYVLVSELSDHQEELIYV